MRPFKGTAKSNGKIGSKYRRKQKGPWNNNDTSSSTERQAARAPKGRKQWSRIIKMSTRNSEW